jgi:hypothetical protein
MVQRVRATLKEKQPGSLIRPDYRENLLRRSGFWLIR